MAGDGFPGVEWIPAHTDRYAVKHSRKIDAIVLHITDGKALDARQTARNVFASPKELGADGKFRQQSSHYIIGRDGTVVQCVRHKTPKMRPRSVSTRPPHTKTAPNGLSTGTPISRPLRTSRRSRRGDRRCGFGRPLNWQHRISIHRRYAAA
jgi:hypothetical protein